MFCMAVRVVSACYMNVLLAQLGYWHNERCTASRKQHIVDLYNVGTTMS